MRNLGTEDFTIHYAHRGVFNAFLARKSLETRSVELLRIIDKRRKVGEDKAREMLAEIAGAQNAADIAAFTRVESDPSLTLKKMKDAVGAENEGAQRLERIGECLERLGVSSSFVLDPSITRGLDYYTGVVFETFLSGLPDIGSVCSGGRYNDLASLYTKQSLPGVGASIGIDRLMAAMEELGLLSVGASASSVLILCLDENLLSSYHGLAGSLRAAGVAAEVFPEKKKLALQFGYAEKKGIPLAVVWGEDEEKAGLVGLKDLRDRQNYPLAPAQVTEKAKELLR